MFKKSNEQTKILISDFRIFLFICFTYMTTFLASPTVANAEDINGVFMVVKGDVTVTGKDNKAEPAKVGKKVFQGDTISAGKEGRAKIVMSDKNVLNISPETQIKIEKYENDGKDKKNVELNVLYGKVRASVEQKYDGEKSKFNIKTPSAVAGVRGTDFLTGYNPGTKAMSVITFTGSVAVGTPGPGGTISNPVFVNQGQMTEAKGGGPPSKPQAVPKEEMQKLNNETKAETAKNGNDNKQDQQAQSDSKKDDKKEDKKDDKKDDKQQADKNDKGDKNGGDKKEASNDKGNGGSEKSDKPNADKNGPNDNGPGGNKEAKNNPDKNGPNDNGPGRNNGNPENRGPASNDGGGGSMLGGGPGGGPGGGMMPGGMGPSMVGSGDLGPDLGKDISFRNTPMPGPVANFNPNPIVNNPLPGQTTQTPILDAVLKKTVKVNIVIQAP